MRRARAVIGLALAACGGQESADPHACGYPAYDCLGGACVDGVCQPVRLAPASNVAAVAVDDTRVYWASFFTNDIDWVSKDGSAHGTLASIADCSANIGAMLAVDSTFVYVACDHELFAVAKDGTVTTLLDAGAVAVTASPSGRVVVAANNVIEAWPPDGGAPLGDGSPWTNLASDDATVYWSDFYPCQIFWHAPCDYAGTVFSTDGWTTAGQPAPFGMMSNGDVLVWTDMCTRTVNVTDHAGATTTIANGLGQKPSVQGLVLDTPPAETGSLAADKAAAYVFATTTTSQRMSLVRVPLDGGTPENLGADTVLPTNVVIDETAVYFGSDDADAGVYRVAKPVP